MNNKTTGVCHPARNGQKKKVIMEELFMDIGEPFDYAVDMDTPIDDNEDPYYTRSSTAGDYSPSCPWNAPGMSIKDFI